MWVDYKPVDVEIDDDNSGIFPCGEEWMNESDHRILVLLKQIYCNIVILLTADNSFFVF